MVVFMGIFESGYAYQRLLEYFRSVVNYISMQGPTDREVVSRSFQEF